MLILVLLLVFSQVAQLQNGFILKKQKVPTMRHGPPLAKF